MQYEAYMLSRATNDQTVLFKLKIHQNPFYEHLSRLAAVTGWYSCSLSVAFSLNCYRHLACGKEMYRV